MDKLDRYDLNILAELQRHELRIGALRGCLFTLTRNSLWRLPPRSRPTRIANEIRWSRGRLMADRFDTVMSFEQGTATCFFIW